MLATPRDHAPELSAGSATDLLPERAGARYDDSVSDVSDVSDVSGPIDLGSGGASRPRLVLTDRNVALATAAIYASAAALAALSFAYVAKETGQADARVGQVSWLYAAVMAVLWLGSLYVLRRRRA